ncbi:hypothetical protein J5X84_23435 [Streptosporangiaceae bacterium NEAU-GS5]|nr:hypothetical protein [Streptosporangiaceae bacterium NEAU-GS5]
MLDTNDRAARRFATACAERDVAALTAVLSIDVMAVCDGGGAVSAATSPIHGADAVARCVMDMLADHPDAAVTVASVNGRAGVVVRRGGQAVAVVGVTVAMTTVTGVWIILNPAKLESWHA